MQLVDPVLVALAVATCIAYAWLGICYASTMMLVASLAGYSLRHCLASILLAQVVTALMTGLVRMNEVKEGSKGSIASSGLIMGFSALASLLAASLIGINLGDAERLRASALILFMTALINLAMPNRKLSANRGQATLVGFLAGFVKGVLGGGATGVIVASQRLLGVNFDNATHTTLFAHLAMCLAALGPYLAIGGLDIGAFLSLSIGSLIGCAIGLAIPRISSPRQRIIASSAISIAIATLMIFKALSLTIGAEV